MLKGILKACILVGCFSVASRVATAQEVIHALTGTVAYVDSSAMTITVYTDNRAQSVFKDQTNPPAPVEFDKNVRADAIATAKKEGAYVIVYYRGGSDTRTAVALRSLGSGPFTTISGTVVKFDNKEHSIAVKDEAGTVEIFKITPDTIAETGVGAVGGFKLRADKGDRVRIVGATVNDSPTALFIKAM
jgi:hypothetical protein